MWAAIVQKEMRENRWKGIIFFLILIASAIAAQALHGMLADLAGDLGPLPGLPSPDIFQQQLADPLLYHWSSWYGKNLYQMTTIFAALIGMSALAGEVSRGTAQFLFTRPLPRRAVLSAKIAGGYTLLAGSMILATLINLLVARIGGMELPARFLAGLPMALLGGLVLYLIAVLASILVDDQVKAGVTTVVTFIILSLPGYFKATAAYSIFRQMASIPVLLGQEWPFLPMLVMAAAAVALYAAGAYLLQQKQFVR